MTNTVERFIEHFIPTNYQLSFDFTEAFDTRAYSGRVIIKGDSTGTHAIKLHAVDLTIDSVHLNAEITEYIYEDNVITIPHENEGAVTVQVNFHGTITDAMHGFYPSYFKHEGQEKILFASQFESHHAREAFPCIDEPEAKATFSLEYSVPEGLTALSNMPPLTTSTQHGLTTILFDETPRMSTYLLAITFGDLQAVSTTTKNGVDVSIYATKAHKKSDLTFALDIATKTLEFYETYFNTPYPLPKSDHIALPDFSSGAMENWGLITYRETCLIAAEDAAVSTKEYVASVIAHELSHQWFGNLVTMKWWDELWLNESFANMMEYVAVDHLHPEWNIWNEFASREVVMALRRDQLPGVQAVHTPVHHPDEISTLFDPAIVYAKGSRLIKMLWEFVGEDAWRDGLHDYFKKHAYQNTTAQDLWGALGKASGKDVAGFINNWLYEPGYPVVSVESSGDSYTLSQKQFLLGDDEKPNIIWQVPIASKTKEPLLLVSPEETFNKTDVLLPLNHNDLGHYIALYDDESFRTLIEKLEQGELSTLDRMALLHEQSLLAKGLKNHTKHLIDLTHAYSNETEEPVWGMLSAVVGDLRRFAEDDYNADRALRSLVGALAKEQYDRLGPKERPEDSETDNKLRAIILSLMSYAQDESYINDAINWYDQVEHPMDIPGEIRSVILSTVARYGNEQHWLTMFNHYVDTTNPEVKNDLMAGICATKRHSDVTHILDAMKNKDIIKPQDVMQWYVMLLRNKHSRESAWFWLIESWEWIVTTFRGDKSYDGFARYSATVLAGKKWLQRFDKFFMPKSKDPALKRTIKVGIVELETRTRWIELHREGVIERLTQ